MPGKNRNDVLFFKNVNFLYFVVFLQKICYNVLLHTVQQHNENQGCKKRGKWKGVCICSLRG